MSATGAGIRERICLSGTGIEKICSFERRICLSRVCVCKEMAFSSRKTPRRNMSVTSSEFEFLHRTSPDFSAGGGGEVGREDSVGGEMERSSEFEVLHEGYLNMSVRVEEEEEDGSGTMARTLRSLRSNGSFSRVSRIISILKPTQILIMCFVYVC